MHAQTEALLPDQDLLVAEVGIKSRSLFKRCGYQTCSGVVADAAKERRHRRADDAATLKKFLGMNPQ